MVDPFKQPMSARRTLPGSLSPGRGGLGQRRSGGAEDFDPDVFAAPPDSARDADVCAPTSDLRRGIALHVLQLAQDDDFFPEIVRVTRDGTNTFRDSPSRDGNGTTRSAAALSARSMKADAA